MFWIATAISGSYGGFSALARVRRHPSRFRCAVTINGVSDIPHLGTSADFADAKNAAETFSELIGDLKTEREKLIEVSPAYHLAEIDTPILVVYGDKDRRVDPDNAHRLLLLLELYGKEHQGLLIPGASHSPTREQWIDTAPYLRAFLAKYLETDALLPPGKQQP